MPDESDITTVKVNKNDKTTTILGENFIICEPGEFKTYIKNHAFKFTNSNDEITSADSKKYYH
jgi:hypothetical protein